MKKFLILSVVVALCSCNSSFDTNELNAPQEVNIYSQKDSKELSQINEKIRTLNQEKVFVNSSNTRRFSFRKFFGIVLSDVFGGMLGGSSLGPVGAAAGAITSSCLASKLGVSDNRYTEYTRFNFPTNGGNGDNNESTMAPMKGYGESLSELVPSTEEHSGAVKIPITDSIGYYHNYTLQKIKEQLSPENFTFESALKVISETTSDIYNVEEAVINHKLHNDSLLFDRIIQTTSVIDETESLDSYFSSVKVQFPEKNQEIDVIKSFFEGIMNSDAKDRLEYLDDVLEIVDQSDLSEDIKRQLKDALIVGNASYKLWDVEEPS